MNYCRKCQSDYEKPGTCNCFAPQVAQPAPMFVPYVPPYTPWWIPPYTWWGSVTVSVPCSVCGKYNCTETHITCGDAITGYTVNADDVKAQSSWTISADLTQPHIWSVRSTTQ